MHNFTAQGSISRLDVIERASHRIVELWLQVNSHSPFSSVHLSPASEIHSPSNQVTRVYMPEQTKYANLLPALLTCGKTHRNVPFLFYFCEKTEIRSKMKIDGLESVCFNDVTREAGGNDVFIKQYAPRSQWASGLLFHLMYGCRTESFNMS